VFFAFVLGMLYLFNLSLGLSCILGTFSKYVPRWLCKFLLVFVFMKRDYSINGACWSCQDLKIIVFSFNLNAFLMRLNINLPQLLSHLNPGNGWIPYCLLIVLFFSSSSKRGNIFFGGVWNTLSLSYNLAYLHTCCSLVHFFCKYTQIYLYIMHEHSFF